MPANVDSMFSVREMPWHREGVVLDEYPATWAEARKLSGLEWDPIGLDVYRFVGLDEETGREVYEVLPEFKQIARSDTGAVLAVQSDTYTIIDHNEMGEILDAVVTRSGAPIRYETAGSLLGGRKVWALAALDEPIEIPGDSSLTLPYMAFTNAHDGSGACTLRATAVRIVCANTWREAEMEGDRTGATFSFRHTRKWRDRIEEAKQAVTLARQEFKAYRDLSIQLMGEPITAGQRELFVAEFFPMPPTGLATDRVIGNVEESRARLRAILASDTTASVADSVYGLVQAAGEYLDYARSTRNTQGRAPWEATLNRTLIKPEPLKAKALKLAREVATADV
jgi:phage/plasmid-like protein (TIGR03299 family)